MVKHDRLPWNYVINQSKIFSSAGPLVVTPTTVHLYSNDKMFIGELVDGPDHGLENAKLIIKATSLYRDLVEACRLALPIINETATKDNRFDRVAHQIRVVLQKVED